MSTETLDIFRAAVAAPTAPAIVQRSGVVNYAELARLSARALAWLDRHVSAARSAPIGVLAEPTVEQIAMTYAVMAAGVPLLPVHPQLPIAERDGLLHQVAARCIVEPGWSERMAADPPPPAGLPGTEPSAEAPLALVQTSGTSGGPRLARLSRRAIVASAEASATRLPWQSSDRWLLALPFAHVGGLSILTRCLSARRCVVLADRRPRRSSHEGLAEALVQHRVTLLSLVPTQVRQLLTERTWRAPDSLRAALVGGAPCPESLLDEAGQRGLVLLPTYGLTETCSQVCTRLPGAVGQRGVGPPLPGVEVRVVDGAIDVRGQILFSGYWEDRAPVSPRDWYRTGDLGHLDDAGCLHVTGRDSEMLITGGENVHPAVVERALEGALAPRRFCVFGRDDATWGQLVALVVEGAEEPGVVERVEQAALDRLARYARPRAIAFVERLPELASGKLSRHGAADLCTERLRSLDYASKR